MADDPTYSAISLFSGAGGMDIGFEQSGRFRVLACAELEEVFCETLEANRAAGRFGAGDALIFGGPIEELDPRELMEAVGLRPGQLDVLIGGPPCQTFSTAGRRDTVQDPRGMLLWQFLRFVEALRPKCFVMENVRGLLSAAVDHRPLKERPNKGGPPLGPTEQPGSVVDLWVSDLERDTGGEYRVDCFEVNAVNYGAPQIRERVFFVGNRDDRMVEFPAPTHRNPYRAVAEPTLDEDAPSFATLGQALARVEGDDGEVMDFSPRKKSFLAMVPEGGNWRSLPEPVQRESMGQAWHAKGGRSGWWRRLSQDLPCPTIVTMPNHASTAMCHPTETRALTLKECAAVQGFPPEWEFRGTTAQKYRQVGNALPIRLAEVVAGVVAEHLDGAGADAPATGAPRYRRVYLDSHVRTRQWFKAGRTFEWKDGEDNSSAHYSGAGKAA
jgi:DNA (cytosine-5)-methyltransferase 1